MRMVGPDNASHRHAPGLWLGDVPCLLQEEPNPPHEQILQVLWLHQRLQRDRLVTTDGCHVAVLHPGFLNREAGPDFRQAVLSFNQDSPRAGDIEIDLHPNGWHQHHHHTNPRFQKVILHVVWDGPALAGVPTLTLVDKLDAPLSEILQWGGSLPEDLFPEHLRGRCCQPLQTLSPVELQEVLSRAALFRLQCKARQLQARARQAGWHQALWEGLFRGLGYKQNVWPMQRLAEIKRHLSPPQATMFSRQAILLGTAGLLPHDLSNLPAEAARHARRLWDDWWRVQDRLMPWILPRSLWQLHGCRPANRPERRLALAAAWLEHKSLPRRLEIWGTQARPDAASRQALLDLLQPPPDPFWSRHWTWTAPPLARPQQLLGISRLADLAANTILPWLWMRAWEGRNLALRQRLEQIYLDWPGGPSNAILRLAERRLLGQSSHPILHGLSMQQGLLQIVRDYCLPAGSLCEGCTFPQRVAEWARRSQK